MVSKVQLPSMPFFTTPEQRCALARQRLFDEGQYPTGMVQDAVIQSWMRCLRARRRPVERIALDAMTRSRARSTLARVRALREAATSELSPLLSALAHTGCRTILTDAECVVVGFGGASADTPGQLLQPALRVGVNLSEEIVGTSAPGIVVKTGACCTVFGGEHFFDGFQPVYCAAAPIRDVEGRLAGVLNLSIEGRRFSFDASALVSLYAAAVENAMLIGQATEQFVVRFHATRALIDTPHEALVGIGCDGRIAWLNQSARCQVDVTVGGVGDAASAFFGLTLGHLLDRARSDVPSALLLPNGLSVWMRAELRARDGATGRLTTAPPFLATVSLFGSSGQASAVSPPTPLHELDRLHVEQTLAACGNNISRAARALGVSRNLLYRRLRKVTTVPGA